MAVLKARVFLLTMKKVKFEVVRYSFEMVNNEPKIVIHQIKVTDENDKYIKFAKLKEVKDHLPFYPVTFKKL